jgi:hypothetical protein
MDTPAAHIEDPFGPIEEPPGEETTKRRRGRPRKNKD